MILIVAQNLVELIINSYYKSIIKFKKNLSINIARAGNVIGGENLQIMKSSGLCKIIKHI